MKKTASLLALAALIGLASLAHSTPAKAFQNLIVSPARQGGYSTDIQVSGGFAHGSAYVRGEGTP